MHWVNTSTWIKNIQGVMIRCSWPDLTLERSLFKVFFNLAQSDTLFLIFWQKETTRGVTAVVPSTVNTGGVIGFSRKVLYRRRQFLKVSGKRMNHTTENYLLFWDANHGCCTSQNWLTEKRRIPTVLETRELNDIFH